MGRSHSVLAYTPCVLKCFHHVNYKCVATHTLVVMRAIKDTVLSTASKNIHTHELVCALEDVSISSTSAAIRNSHPVANFEEYNQGLNQ